MNINEYIEKYSEIKKSKTQLTITMCVPRQKEILYVWQENDNSNKHMIIDERQIASFLESKGYQGLKVAQTAGINNKHPRALTATWIFKYKTLKSVKRQKTSEK
jgi:hypothetical protein|tara:strand:- start:1449 stop:1760 length:312 start_codon:yes stop_codon:yes gene_type:complete